jgi:hypothetical protein
MFSCQRLLQASADTEPDSVGNTVIAKFDVELMRGSPEYLARMDASRRFAPTAYTAKEAALWTCVTRSTMLPWQV